MENVPDLPDNFYAGIGFRTDQQNGLMFYHQGQVKITLITVLLIKSYLKYIKQYNVCVCVSLQSDVCQVALDSGHVVVSAGNEGVKSQKTYNDDNSHYVAFYRNTNGCATVCLC